MEFRHKKEMRPESGKRLGKGGNYDRGSQGLSSWAPGYCNVLLVLPLSMEVSVNNTKPVQALISSLCLHVYLNKIGLNFPGEPGKQNPRAG